ncbi:DUF1104 domain-containing protein [Helicobacter sp. MIT 14-3879]|uniref:DUF1104 domain-containing protein n=1 Tax=Helicobacter sp. MIT 14-3879 TaxID=2040649 RepID=UPI000E1FA5E3|nr:DUF1104 domain-containing protein [Helicobacter sp. MIT 14-3879]RDU65478.1 hypothetical protein CQA44_00345 [Helicobacter sp. MIT 14-3879]
MKKLILGAIVLSSILFSADYSSKSDNDLINLAGTIEPKDIPSYFDEIEKRVNEMTMKDAREFKMKVKEQENKVYDKMKVKDFKARQKAIMEVMGKNNKGFRSDFRHSMCNNILDDTQKSKKK